MRRKYRMTGILMAGMILTVGISGNAYALPGDEGIWAVVDKSGEEGESFRFDTSDSAHGPGAGGTSSPDSRGGFYYYSGQKPSDWNAPVEYYSSGCYDEAVYYSCHEIQTEEDARAQMTTITVPVWRLNGTSKTAGTAAITVNSGIADRVALVFQEIYEGPQQFPMSDLGGYSWRGEGSRSEHNMGTAIDLNSSSNYCIYANGTVVGDHWTPGEDPYSFSADCDVVKAFKKYGFAWGGDWAWENQDYMHFSYFGT